MHKWKWKLCLTALLSYGISVAIADTATSGVSAVSGVSVASSVVGPDVAAAIKAGTASPAQYFDAAEKYEKDGDMITSLELYRRAADGGHAEAQARYAYRVYVSSHYKQALDYYRKSAAQGNIEGQFGVAMMIGAGDGGIQKDLVEARKWYVLAMNGGHKMALKTLAYACIGVDEKIREELSRTNRKRLELLDHDNPIMCGSEELALIKRAADDNDIHAIQTLAKAYRLGMYGLAVDLKMAADLEAKDKKLRGISEGKKKKTRLQR